MNYEDLENVSDPKTTEIQNLKDKLEHAEKYIHELQEKNQELEDALKMVSFTTAGINNELNPDDQFNKMHNPYWIVIS